MLDLIVRNATLPDGRAGLDIAVLDGRIAEVATAIEAVAGEEIDAAGHLVTAPFVDSHFHMDATLSLGLPRFNETGTLLEGIALWGELAPTLTPEAVKRRAHGTLPLVDRPGNRRDPQPCGRYRSVPDGRRGAARGQARGCALDRVAARRLPPQRLLPHPPIC